MSESLTLRFASDMPSASVEVVSAEQQTVGRVWLGPGDQTTLDVPSAEAFVQVHMPSGATVTLHDPTSLDREISWAALEADPSPTPPRFGLDALHERAAEQRRTPAGGLKMSEGAVPAERPPFQELTVTLHSSGAPEAPTGDVAPTWDKDGGGLVFNPTGPACAYDLHIHHIRHGDAKPLHVRLPGSLAALAVVLRAEGPSAHVLRVEAATRHEDADTLGAYLAQGDLRSAASMTSWARRAEEMLQQKGADPGAATVGAYLLLRLRRFDLMHDWTRTLADRWPDLPDGGVIWGWQQMLQTGNHDEARRHFRRAAESPHLPVYSEGLRLLLDGLRVLKLDPLADALARRVGIVRWDSPFTAVFPSGDFTHGQPLSLRVRYAVGRLPVESSAFASIGYDAAVLTVEFDSGTVCEYYAVPAEVYEAFRSAPSLGGYFNREIQDRYASRRLR